MDELCRGMWDALSAYVDSALPPDEVSRVEAHLERCQRCRETLLELQAMRQSVRALPTYEPPPMLKARILAATVDQPTLWERLAAGWPRLVWRTSFVTALFLLSWLGWQLVPKSVTDAPRRWSATKPQTAAPSYQEKQVRIPKTLAKASPTPKQGYTAVKGQRSAMATRATPSQPTTHAAPQWRSLARTPSVATTTSADALHGEPLLPDEVVVEEPQPAESEAVAVAEAEETETSTVARHSFTLPAEVLNRGKSGMELLREQVRIRSQETLSSDMKRKLQRNQVDVDVITVRF